MPNYYSEMIFILQVFFENFFRFLEVFSGIIRLFLLQIFKTKCHSERSAAEPKNLRTHYTAKCSLGAKIFRLVTLAQDDRATAKTAVRVFPAGTGIPPA